MDKPSRKKTHEHAASGCPVCFRKLDSSSGLKDVDTPRPDPGDPSVCMYCGTILIYEADLTVRLIKENEVNEFTPRIIKQLAFTQKAVQLFHEARGKKHVNQELQKKRMKDELDKFVAEFDLKYTQTKGTG